mmetsp:Transcript_20735/g.58317  ORF Transcript_20735/g.58317 Transcript_20735/m.58317 type:complete len:230 (-) Transcript_20735:828-1517(-)
MQEPQPLRGAIKLLTQLPHLLTQLCEPLLCLRELLALGGYFLCGLGPALLCPPELLIALAHLRLAFLQLLAAALDFLVQGTVSLLDATELLPAVLLGKELLALSFEHLKLLIKLTPLCIGVIDCRPCRIQLLTFCHQLSTCALDVCKARATFILKLTLSPRLLICLQPRFGQGFKFRVTLGLELYKRFPGPLLLLLILRDACMQVCQALLSCASFVLNVDQLCRPIITP